MGATGAFQHEISVCWGYKPEVRAPVLLGHQTALREHDRAHNLTLG